MGLSKPVTGLLYLLPSLFKTVVTVNRRVKKPPSHIGVYLYMQSLQNIEN